MITTKSDCPRQFRTDLPRYEPDTSRKFPPAWGLIAAVAFGVAVIAAIIKFI